jgi:hypothetical protein
MTQSPDGSALRTRTSRLEPAALAPTIICVIADIMGDQIDDSAQDAACNYKNKYPGRISLLEFCRINFVVLASRDMVAHDVIKYWRRGRINVHPLQS